MGEKFPVLRNLRAGAQLLRHFFRDIAGLLIVSLVLPAAGGIDKGVIAQIHLIRIVVLIVADIADVGAPQHEGGHQKGQDRCRKAPPACPQRGQRQPPGGDPPSPSLLLSMVLPVQKGLDHGRRPALHPEGGKVAARPGSKKGEKHCRQGRPQMEKAQLQPYTRVSLHNPPGQPDKHAKSKRQPGRNGRDAKEQRISAGKQSRLPRRHSQGLHSRQKGQTLMQGYSHNIVDEKEAPCHHKKARQKIADCPCVCGVHPGGIVGEIRGKGHIPKPQIRQDLLCLVIQILRLPEHDAQGDALLRPGLLPKAGRLLFRDPGAGLGVDIFPGPEAAEGEPACVLCAFPVPPFQLDRLSRLVGQP